MTTTVPSSSTADTLASVIPRWPENAELRAYTGGCHCKKFRYRFSHPPFEDGQYDVVMCNCSICVARGKLNV